MCCWRHTLSQLVSLYFKQVQLEWHKAQGKWDFWGISCSYITTKVHQVLIFNLGNLGAGNNSPQWIPHATCKYWQNPKFLLFQIISSACMADYVTATQRETHIHTYTHTHKERKFACNCRILKVAIKASQTQICWFSNFE